MPHVELNGVSIYYEETGEGPPMVFSHEFAGDYRSWQPQVDHFQRDYRCVTWNYRGYPPSDVPEDRAMYSQAQLVDDLKDLLDHLEIDRAHVVGLSMGGSVTLHFALTYPERCLSAVVAGAGSGSVNRELFEEDVARIIESLTSGTMAEFAETYGLAPTRTPFMEKDRPGWELFKRQLAEHSTVGSANMMRNVQLKRPTIFSLENQLEELTVPTLILVGDEDEPCIEPGVFMRRKIPSSGLMFLPQSGHTINLEEPALFNQAIVDFLGKVEGGTWRTRGQVTTSMMPPEE